MKSLTEKIIDLVKYRASTSDNSELKKELECLAEEIQEVEDKAEFEEVARVFMKHLCTRIDLYHPHHTVIITSTTCELVEGVKCTPKITDYIID